MTAVNRLMLNESEILLIMLVKLHKYVVKIVLVKVKLTLVTTNVECVAALGLMLVQMAVTGSKNGYVVIV